MNHSTNSIHFNIFDQNIFLTLHTHQYIGPGGPKKHGNSVTNSARTTRVGGIQFLLFEIIRVLVYSLIIFTVTDLFVLLCLYTAIFLFY